MAIRNFKDDGGEAGAFINKVGTYNFEIKSAEVISEESNKYVLFLLSAEEGTYKYRRYLGDKGLPFYKAMIGATLNLSNAEKAKFSFDDEKIHLELIGKRVSAELYKRSYTKDTKEIDPDGEMVTVKKLVEVLDIRNFKPVV